MDDPQNEDARRARAGADDDAQAGELVPDQDTKFGALCEAMFDARLSFADVRVYSALLSQPLYEREGITACRPSRARLARDSRLHLLSIARCVKALADLGYLEVIHGTGRATSRYTLLRLARGNGTVTGNDAVTGNSSPTPGLTSRLPLKDCRGNEDAVTTGVLELRGNEAVTQLLRQPHSVALSRAASDSAADSGHHKEQGSDKTLKATAGRRKNTRQQPAAEKAPEPAGPAAGLWTDGLAYLMTSASLKESTARGFLGRFVKAAGSNETALQLIAEAKRLQVANPQAWLMKAASARRTPAGAVPVETRTVEQIDADNAAEARRFGYGA